MTTTGTSEPVSKRCLIILLLVLFIGCVATVLAQPPTDFSAVAGTWSGTLQARSRMPVSTRLTIKENGDWENLISGPGVREGTMASRATGTARIEGGTYRWRSAASGRTGV